MILRGLVLAAILAATVGPAGAACRADRVALKGPQGQARFSVEVADDAQERAVGLMNRDHMASGAGMLFIYERPQRASFWMRNTLIPLDMIFADARGRVTAIHENAIPLDETPIDGGTGVKYVLEINGGLAHRLGLSVGSLIQHPAIEDPAWPCD